MRAFLATACLLGLSDCTPSTSVPTLQVSSPHFRYFARTAADVQNDVLDRLERARADIYTYLNLSDDAVVNYYLFDDLNDLATNSQCGRAQDCTEGRNVYSVSPLLEHELIHAFLAGRGSPAPPIAEGIAEGLGCNRTNLSPQVEPDWRRCVSEYPTTDPTIYASDQRFVKALLIDNGADRFLNYYQDSSNSQNPEVFAAEFMSFWGQSIDQAWSTALTRDVLDDGVSPICPCATEALVPNVGDVTITHLNAPDYRPIPFAPGASSLFRFTMSGGAFLQDCGRDTSPLPVIGAGDGASLVLVHALPQPHFFSFQTPGTEVVSAADGPNLTSDCSSAGSLTLDGAAHLTILMPPLTGSDHLYMRVSATAGKMLRRIDPAMNGFQGDVRICDDCTLTSCKPLSSLTGPVSAIDGAVLEFGSMLGFAQPLASVSLEVL